MNWLKALGYIVRYAPVVIEVIKQVIEAQKKSGAPIEGPKVAAFLASVNKQA